MNAKTLYPLFAAILTGLAFLSIPPSHFLSSFLTPPLEQLLLGKHSQKVLLTHKEKQKMKIFKGSNVFLYFYFYCLFIRSFAHFFSFFLPSFLPSFPPDEAKRYAKRITSLLANLPREMLLLLKTNDCLRGVDYDLGCPGTFTPTTNTSYPLPPDTRNFTSLISSPANSDIIRMDYCSFFFFFFFLILILIVYYCFFVPNFFL